MDTVFPYSASSQIARTDGLTGFRRLGNRALPVGMKTY